MLGSIRHMSCNLVHCIIRALAFDPGLGGRFGCNRPHNSVRSLPSVNGVSLVRPAAYGIPWAYIVPS